MIDAVFISDLHLHPERHDICKRFDLFIQWASENTRVVYILGDFFHVWAGDDSLEPWSYSIAKQLSWLASKGIKLYFMHGNRDFLIGKRFATLASLTFLPEPTVITLDETKILLVHGDRYCTKDLKHQWLRRLTRNSIFPRFFLCLPRTFRFNLVNRIRQQSQANRDKPASYMDVVALPMLKHMQHMHVNILVHGHTHKPGLTQHEHQGELYQQFVLSDWDDNPMLMCYDKTNGLYFNRMAGG